MRLAVAASIVLALIVTSCTASTEQTPTSLAGIDPSASTTLPESDMPGGIYAAAAARMDGNDAVLFGGFDDGIPNSDTWRFSAMSWTNVDPTTSPSPRGFHSLTTVDSRGGALLLGGSTSDRGFQCTLGNCLASSFLGDMWLFQPESDGWVQLHPEGGPGPVMGHAAAYSAPHGTLVVFGGVLPPTGIDGKGVLTDETWLFDPEREEWEQVSTDHAPMARAFHQMVFDETSQDFYMWGGYLGGSSSDPDVWRFDLDDQTWTSLAPDGIAPSGRWSHAMSFDAVSASLIAAGGVWYDNGKLTAGSDVWVYDPSTNAWNPGTDFTNTIAMAASWQSAAGLSILESGVTAEYVVADESWRTLVAENP